MSAASATNERGSVALQYLDVVLVLIVAVVLLATDVPKTGLVVGAAAWIVLRVAQVAADKQLANVHDLRRRLGLGVAFSLLRVWLLAGAIIVCGLAVSRANGLTAALVIFGAFSVNFVRNAATHIGKARARSTTG